MAWGSISLSGGFLDNESSLETMICNYMAQGSISLSGGFLENESSLETMINSFSLKIKYFEISVLTANSQYLQTAALKHALKRNFLNNGKVDFADHYSGVEG